MRNSSSLVVLFAIVGIAAGVWADNVLANQFFNAGYDQSVSANPLEAVRSYDVALALNPSHAAALLNRGSARAALGQLDGALADCDKAIGIGGTSEFLAGAHYIRSSIKRDSGKIDGALADLNRSIDLNPYGWQAVYERGLLRAESGDKTGAIADFSESIRLNPNHAESYAARAYELDHLDDRDALADYDQALALDPANVTALYGRSYVRMRMGDKEGAISDLKELVKRETPCSADLRKLLQCLQADKQAHTQASPEIRRFTGHSCGIDVA